jgi:hypothetical protein
MGLYSIPTNPLFGHFGRKDWPGSLSVSKRRKVFFSFHFDDVMRVNVVRNAWKFHRPESLLTPGFYDSSLWERRQREGDESLKQLIREGVDHTSAVCVLIGRDTWARRWVRYEIARAVIDGRGLLGIHINRIRHHSTKTSVQLGRNPLEFLAVGKVQETWLAPAKYYLFERDILDRWVRYQDYTSPLNLPLYLSDPAPDYVIPLSSGTMVRDFVIDEGHKNIGLWIDVAAQRVGR